MLLRGLHKNTLPYYSMLSTAQQQKRTTVHQETNNTTYNFLPHFLEMKTQTLISHSSLRDFLHEINCICYSLALFCWSSHPELSAPLFTVGFVEVLDAQNSDSHATNSKSSITTCMFKNKFIKLNIQKLSNNKTLHFAKNRGMSQSP